MIEVLQTGFYTTVQDMGRFDYQEYGVPVSGVMDTYSAKIANAIVGNDENAAVFEITMTGPVLKFHSNTVIAISGADMSPKLNGKAVALNNLLNILQGDELSFGKLRYGFRTYVAIFGGLMVPDVLKSKSKYKGITPDYRINKGNTFKIKEVNEIVASSHASIKVNNQRFENNSIDVLPGPEFDKLSNTQQKQLFECEFTISKDNSRMAYQLDQTFENNLEPIITSLVMPGTVQLTPSGKLIILMKDCQTTGGYPRILQLKESSINWLSQRYTGSTIKFRLLS